MELFEGLCHPEIRMVENVSGMLTLDVHIGNLLANMPIHLYYTSINGHIYGFCEQSSE